MEQDVVQITRVERNKVLSLQVASQDAARTAEEVVAAAKLYLEFLKS